MIISKYSIGSYLFAPTGFPIKMAPPQSINLWFINPGLKLLPKTTQFNMKTENTTSSTGKQPSS